MDFRNCFGGVCFIYTPVKLVEIDQLINVYAWAQRKEFQHLKRCGEGYVCPNTFFCVLDKRRKILEIERCNTIVGDRIAVNVFPCDAVTVRLSEVIRNLVCGRHCKARRKVLE